MSAIEVERDAGSPAVSNQLCRVVIDSLERGYVSHGERQAFDVPPGVHTVKISVDGAECPPVKVFVGLGVTSLLCSTQPPRRLGLFTLSAAKTKIAVREEREMDSCRDIGPGERVLPAGSVPMPKAFLRARRTETELAA